MSKDGKDKPESKTRHRELHEDAAGHPHHREADHVRHHHLSHILKHHRDETGEEKRFVERENHLHRLEMNREIWEDESGRKQMRKVQKASATPGQAIKESEIASATPGSKRKGTRVKSSSSSQVAERLNSLRLRIAFARTKNRERGEMTFGK